MTITQADLAITKFIDARQAELDQAAATARVACIAEFRLAILEGSAGRTEAYQLVAETVASLVSVGRDSDGYPELVIPEEAKQLLKRASKAGVVPSNGRLELGSLRIYWDMSGISEKGSLSPAWQADYEAWNAAKNYREVTKR
jgi:hypothetical protein